MICIHFEKCIVMVIRSRKLRWAGHIARMEEGRSTFRILTGKISLGRLKRRWEDNVRKDLKRMGINTRNLVESAQDRDYWRPLLMPQ